MISPDFRLPASTPDVRNSSTTPPRPSPPNAVPAVSGSIPEEQGITATTTLSKTAQSAESHSSKHTPEARVAPTSGGSSPAAAKGTNPAAAKAPSESCTMKDLICPVRGCKQVFRAGEDQRERLYNHLADCSIRGSQQVQHFQAYNALITGKPLDGCSSQQALAGNTHTEESRKRFGGEETESKGEDEGWGQVCEREPGSAYIMYYVSILLNAFSDAPEFAVPFVSSD